MEIGMLIMVMVTLGLSPSSINAQPPMDSPSIAATPTSMSMPPMTMSSPPPMMSMPPMAMSSPPTMMGMPPMAMSSPPTMMDMPPTMSMPPMAMASPPMPGGDMAPGMTPGMAPSSSTEKSGASRLHGSALALLGLGGAMALLF